MAKLDLTLTQDSEASDLMDESYLGDLGCTTCCCCSCCWN